jgi:hypothetical protein
LSIVSGPIPLPYAAAAKGWRRRFKRALLLGLALLLAIAVAVEWRQLTTAAMRLRVAYWRRQCRHYLDQRGSVIYDDDPQRAAVLLAADHHGNLIEGKRQSLAGRRAVWRRAVPLERYNAIAATRTQDDQELPCLFLHELQTPNGHHSLTELDFVVAEVPGWAARPTNFTITFYDPQDFREDVNNKLRWVAIARFKPELLLADDTSIRFYAPELLPDDPTGFRMNFETNEATGTYEFHLADGDAIKYHVSVRSK